MGDEILDMYKGETTGTTDREDNVRMINATACTVAGFSISLLESNVEIKLLNMQGQQVNVPLILDETNAVSLKALPSGMYIIEIRTEELVSIQKFIKQ